MFSAVLFASYALLSVSFSAVNQPVDLTYPTISPAFFPSSTPTPRPTQSYMSTSKSVSPVILPPSISSAPSGLTSQSRVSLTAWGGATSSSVVTPGGGVQKQSSTGAKPAVQQGNPYM